MLGADCLDEGCGKESQLKQAGKKSGKREEVYLGDGVVCTV